MPQHATERCTLVRDFFAFAGGFSPVRPVRWRTTSVRDLPLDLPEDCTVKSLPPLLLAFAILTSLLAHVEDLAAFDERAILGR